MSENARISSYARAIQRLSDEVGLVADKLKEIEANAGEKRARIQQAVADLDWAKINIVSALRVLGYGGTSSKK